MNNTESIAMETKVNQKDEELYCNVENLKDKSWITYLKKLQYEILHGNTSNVCRLLQLKDIPKEVWLLIFDIFVKVNHIISKQSCDYKKLIHESLCLYSYLPEEILEDFLSKVKDSRDIFICEAIIIQDDEKISLDTFEKTVDKYFTLARSMECKSDVKRFYDIMIKSDWFYTSKTIADKLILDEWFIELIDEKSEYILVKRDNTEILPFPIALHFLTEGKAIRKSSDYPDWFNHNCI